MEQSKFEIVLINDETEFNSRMAADLCATGDFASCNEPTSDTCIFGDYGSGCVGSDYCTIDFS